MRRPPCRTKGFMVVLLDVRSTGTFGPPLRPLVLCARSRLRRERLSRSCSARKRRRAYRRIRVVRICEELYGSRRENGPVTDQNLSDQQSRLVASQIREELARRRISRRGLADLAKISISTLEKALSGRRPFTLATTIRSRGAGVSLRPRTDAARTERARAGRTRLLFAPGGGVARGHGVTAPVVQRSRRDLCLPHRDPGGRGELAADVSRIRADRRRISPRPARFRCRTNPATSFCHQPQRPYRLVIISRPDHFRRDVRHHHHAAVRPRF